MILYYKLFSPGVCYIIPSQNGTLKVLLKHSNNLFDFSNGTLPRSSSRNRTSSSSGSKLTGSPATSVIEAPSTVINSALTPQKTTPAVTVPVRSTVLKPIVTTSVSQPRSTISQTSSPSSIFTLQVMSRTGNEKPLVCTNTNSNVTTTITGNSSSTRLSVIQSPARSVVTLNGSPVVTSVPHTESPRRPRPSSLYSPREKQPVPVPPTPNPPSTVYLSTSKQFTSVENLTNRNGEDVASIKLMNANQKNIKATTNIKTSNNDSENHQPTTTSESMNNIIDLSRKKSETLSSLKNLLYSSNTELNSFESSSAALMSLDKPLRASDSMNLVENMDKVPCSPTKTLPDDNLILDKINGDLLHSSYPSLSDLTVHFKSLAAQKILKGISINSIDTLVEVNMAAANNEKQNNCDVTIHTDFGLV
jgi:hypothetical protein